MEVGAEEMREAAGQVSKWWWLWLVMGIIWVILSLVVLQFSDASITTVGVVVGILILVAGLQQFFVAYLSESWKWLWVVFGVLFVIAGIVALAYPKNTFAAIADMLGFLFLLFGVFWIIQAVASKEINDLWWLGLIAGIGMILIAFWTAGQFFITKAYTLMVFAGIWAMLHGVTDIINSFQIRKMGKT